MNNTTPPVPDADPLPAGYPSHFEADVVLADGGTVLVRPIRPADGPALLRFHERLSPESIYLRYLGQAGRGQLVGTEGVPDALRGWPASVCSVSRCPRWPRWT
jgi:hypothetical protein